MKDILGYLGPSGTYSDAVRKQLYPESAYPRLQFQQYPSLAELMHALENLEVSLALFPVETSKMGVLQDNEDQEFFAKLITSKANLFIVAEKFWPLKYFLLGCNGSRIEEVKKVHLNPYTEQHCLDYLSQYRNWELCDHYSSSQAAKAVKESSDLTQAAIASEDSAREYGLIILDELFKSKKVPLIHFLAFGNDLAKAFVSTPREPLMSSFAINAPQLKSFQLYVESQKLEVSLYRQSKQEPDTLIVDIKGVLSENQMNAVLKENFIIKFLGSFTSCPERHLYHRGVLINR